MLNSCSKFGYKWWGGCGSLHCSDIFKQPELILENQINLFYAQLFRYELFWLANVPQTSMTAIFKQLQKNRIISQSVNFRVISICHEKYLLSKWSENSSCLVQLSAASYLTWVIDFPWQVLENFTLSV